jgi:hypothetical protein
MDSRRRIASDAAMIAIASFDAIDRAIDPIYQFAVAAAIVPNATQFAINRASGFRADRITPVV